MKKFLTLFMIVGAFASFTCYGAIPDTKEKSKTELASVTMVKSDFSTDFVITPREAINEIYLAPVVANYNLSTSGIKRSAKAKSVKKPDKPRYQSRINQDFNTNFRQR